MDFSWKNLSDELESTWSSIKKSIWEVDISDCYFFFDTLQQNFVTQEKRVRSSTHAWQTNVVTAPRVFRRVLPSGARARPDTPEPCVMLDFRVWTTLAETTGCVWQPRTGLRVNVRRHLQVRSSFQFVGLPFDLIVCIFKIKLSRCNLCKISKYQWYAHPDVQCKESLASCSHYVFVCGSTSAFNTVPMDWPLHWQ